MSWKISRKVYGAVPPEVSDADAVARARRNAREMGLKPAGEATVETFVLDHQTVKLATIEAEGRRETYPAIHAGLPTVFRRMKVVRWGAD